MYTRREHLENLAALIDPQQITNSPLVAPAKKIKEKHWSKCAKKVKSYAELLAYNEINSFGEAERVVSSFVPTEVKLSIIRQIITDLTAARQSERGTLLPALQVLTGPRGGEKPSPGILRAVIETRSLRKIIGTRPIPAGDVGLSG